MKTSKLFGGLAIALCTILLFALAVVPHKKQTVSANLSNTQNYDEQAVTAPSLTNVYKNEQYRFQVRMPANFTAHTVSSDNNDSSTVLLQDSKGDGIQILISKYDKDTKIITADDVRANIPDMKVEDEQVVEVGDDYKGVAFKSDNEAFGGSSREVWFVFRGNLYQISTYARLDAYLKAMFATWKFY